MRDRPELMTSPPQLKGTFALLEVNDRQGQSGTNPFQQEISSATSGQSAVLVSALSQCKVGNLRSP